MPKPKWQEPVEQWLGHFIGLGIVLGFLIGPAAIIVNIVRELTAVKIFGWKFGQWPPGHPMWLYWSSQGKTADNSIGRWSTRASLESEKMLVNPLDRVEDTAKDLKFALTGCAIGIAIRMLIW